MERDERKEKCTFYPDFAGLISEIAQELKACGSTARQEGSLLEERLYI